MPSFLKRNKYFTIVYTDKSGRRRWESTRLTDYHRAKEYYYKYIRIKESNYKMLISDLTIELEKKLLNRLSKTTIEMYLTKLNILIATIGDKEIVKITGSDIEEFMANRLQSGISITTINIDYRTIRSAFNRAITMGYLSMNPCRNVEQYRHTQVDPAVFSEDEVLHLVESENNPLFKVFWKMLYLTAARRGEILFLEWNDIDFQKRTIRLRNKKDHILKTKKPRTIPLSSVLFETLIPLPRKGSFIFCKENGKVYSGTYVSKRFKTLLRQLGFSEKSHLHCLRHSAATQMNEMGETSFNIQNSLGHSSVSTTQLYIQSSPETLRDGFEKISQIFKKSNGLNSLDGRSIHQEATDSNPSNPASLSLVS